MEFLKNTISFLVCFLNKKKLESHNFSLMSNSTNDNISCGKSKILQDNERFKDYLHGTTKEKAFKVRNSDEFERCALRKKIVSPFADFIIKTNISKSLN